MLNLEEEVKGPAPETLSKRSLPTFDNSRDQLVMPQIKNQVVKSRQDPEQMMSPSEHASVASSQRSKLGELRQLTSPIKRPIRAPQMPKLEL